MKSVTFRHEFVEYLPPELAAGVLYVSIPYATAAHKCACGCGNDVITPITPTDWQLTFDGESVSLHPSIGNWSFPCQSHYWVRHNQIQWSRRWSQHEIEAGRAQDQRAKRHYFEPTPAKPPKDEKPKKGRWQQFRKRFL